MKNGQTAELIALFAKQVALDMPEDIAQGWIENPKSFGRVINDALMPKVDALHAVSEFTTKLLEIEPICKGWSEFYNEFFGINIVPEVMYSVTPKQVKGFDRLIVVPQGITVNLVWEVCGKHFKCWKYTDSDLETAVQTNDRDPRNGTYAIWVRDRVEADEETANLSANQLKKQKIKGITLLERLIHELKYFSETGKHLDISNLTLCSGSRYSGGNVPYAYWFRTDDEFQVSWSSPDSRNSALRSRVAVTL